MSDPNSYANRPLYYYPQENSQFVPSSSYIRNNQDSFTPTHSRISNIELPNAQYVPKIIESGYIVGPPIAYTQTPNLPHNFHAFSPAKSTGPIEVANSSSKIVFNHPSHIYPTSNSEIKPAPPTIVIHSPNKQEETVSRVLYDRSVIESKNWETKYNDLQVSYNSLLAGQTNNGSELQEENRRLKQRIRQLEQRERNDMGSSKNIRQLIQKYKESTLKQCYLLLDRYRLECKQRE